MSICFSDSVPHCTRHISGAQCLHWSPYWTVQIQNIFIAAGSSVDSAVLERSLRVLGGKCYRRRRPVKMGYQESSEGCRWPAPPMLLEAQQTLSKWPLNGQMGWIWVRSRGWRWDDDLGRPSGGWTDRVRWLVQEPRMAPWFLNLLLYHFIQHLILFRFEFFYSHFTLVSPHYSPSLDAATLSRDLSICWLHLGI